MFVCLFVCLFVFNHNGIVWRVRTSEMFCVCMNEREIEREGEGGRERGGREYECTHVFSPSEKSEENLEVSPCIVLCGSQEINSGNYAWQQHLYPQYKH